MMTIMGLAAAAGIVVLLSIFRHVLPRLLKGLVFAPAASLVAF